MLALLALTLNLRLGWQTDLIELDPGEQISLMPLSAASIQLDDTPLAEPCCVPGQLAPLVLDSQQRLGIAIRQQALNPALAVIANAQGERLDLQAIEQGGVQSTALALRFPQARTERAVAIPQRNLFLRIVNTGPHAFNLQALDASENVLLSQDVTAAATLPLDDLTLELIPTYFATFPRRQSPLELAANPSPGAGRHRPAFALAIPVFPPGRAHERSRSCHPPPESERRSPIPRSDRAMDRGPYRMNEFTAPAPVVVGIAGGSGSGKTTVIQRLLERVGWDRIAYLPHDAYYKDASHLPALERTHLNFDHPNSLDNKLLIAQIHTLLDGQAVDVPLYDFTTYTRRTETRRVLPSPVILVEGILVFADEVLRDLMDIKIYVETDPDIRFIRRLRRDIEERERSVQSVIEQYLSTVRPMHLQFVEPSKRYADLIIPEGGYNDVALEMVISRIENLLAAGESEAAREQG